MSAPPTGGFAPPDSPYVDGCAFHEWPSTSTLTAYMGEAWQELLLRPGDPTGPADLRAGSAYADPRTGGHAGAGPLGGGVLLSDTNAQSAGPPGSDYETFREGVLRRGPDRVVIGYDISLPATGLTLPFVAREVVRAANDWTAEEWLTKDDSVYGMVLVATSLPNDAAAEIRRAGANDRMVAVALGCNAFNRPFGDPIYHPIYEAASEMGLPLVIQIGSDEMATQLAPAVTGGQPTTYAEYRVLGVQSQMSHLLSMLNDGVFARYPDLKLLLVGGGAAWIAPWLWRIDYRYKMDRHTQPWLRMRPSDYFRKNVRVSTHSLESPSSPERLARALGVFEGIEQVLTYTSCWPRDDAEGPESIAARLPESWHERVFHQNALEFFRWPAEAARLARSPSASTRGA